MVLNLCSRRNYSLYFNMADAGRNDNTIQLKVVSQNQEVNFRLKRTTALGRVMNHYTDHFSSTTGRSALRFLFDGRRINDDDTPESLELESEDVIEVVGEQFGGCQSGDGRV